MIALEFPMGILAVVTGIATLSTGIYILTQHRTALLRYFIIFNIAIFCMTLGFAFRSFTSWMIWIATSSIHEQQIQETVRVMQILAVLVQITGAILLTATLPFFIYSLFDRQPGTWLIRVGIASSVIMAPLAIGYLWTFDIVIMLFASAILFSNIALALGIIIKMIIERKGKPPAGLLSNQKSIKFLKNFLLLTIGFFPLFLADMLISNIPVGPLIKIVDNTSVPLYFLILNLGAIGLLRFSLDHPPLMENNTISEFGKKSFGLTDRETEIVEYVLDGYTLKDLANVLKISPKTAENHLYNVYQKIGVTNRIQLFQFFQNQKRES
jgi:DNA-binding CsgD family transcriptional regulator